MHLLHPQPTGSKPQHDAKNGGSEAELKFSISSWNKELEIAAVQMNATSQKYLGSFIFWGKKANPK